MSICRWSCNDSLCNLYIYESCHGGFSINVANSKVVYLEPLPPEIPFGEEGWLERVYDVRELKKEHVPIGLPYDGQSFSCDTAEEAMKVVDMLKEAGYTAPYDRIYAALMEEYNEHRTQTGNHSPY